MDQPLKFAILTFDEASGADIVWGIDVDHAETSPEAVEMRAGEKHSQRGRLRTAFAIGPSATNSTTFQAGAIVLMDDFGLHMIEYRD
jgi:hypothetical protein